MASPQLETGYAKISNEILEAFARTPPPGKEAFQVLMLVIRFTYGFHRKRAEMSINFIAKGTGLSKRSVSRALKILVSNKTLVRTQSSIEFNKNYDEWVVSKRTGGGLLDRGGVSYKRTKVVSIKTDKKDRIKIKIKNNTAATEVTAGKDEINLILEVFQMNINPTINYGNKTQRKAVEQLITFMGLEKLKRTIEYVISIRSEQFAPSITTPYQLKEKLAQLISYQQKQSSKPKLVTSI